jgi:superfamily I DNA and/or RNA helicase
MLIAYYNFKAWIIVGDPRQLKPFIALDIERKNPFRPSIKMSTLSRATEAKAVVQHLNVNYRQYDDLIILPSELCYLKEMCEAYDMIFTKPVRN